MTLKFKEQTALFIASNFFVDIIVFRSTDHQSRSILDKSLCFSYAGLTLIPRALSVPVTRKNLEINQRNV